MSPTPTPAAAALAKAYHRAEHFGRYDQCLADHEPVAKRQADALTAAGYVLVPQALGDRIDAMQGDPNRPPLASEVIAYDKGVIDGILVGREQVAPARDADGEQCPERCLGVLGHEGVHQTSDGRPLLFAGDMERLARTLLKVYPERFRTLLGRNGVSFDFPMMSAAILAALEGQS